MPIFSHSSRRAVPQRMAVCGTYLMLSALGLTMVIPFLITLTLSISNAYDYKRFSVFPRYAYSDEDRFVKYLPMYFSLYSGWQTQMAASFPAVPASWISWDVIGQDNADTDALAKRFLDRPSEELPVVQAQARDYADFCDTYPLDDSVVVIPQTTADAYLSAEYRRLWVEKNGSASTEEEAKGAINLLRETWNIPFTDFNQINFTLEMKSPMWQQSWFPPNDPKSRSFLELKRASRNLDFMPDVRDKWSAFLRQNGSTGDTALAPDAPPEVHALWLKFKEQVVPASPAIPYALRVDWRKYLQSEAVHQALNLGRTESFDIDHYNRLAGTHYETWNETPFPLPASASPALQQLWNSYAATYPVRLTTLVLTPELSAQFQTYLLNRFKTIGALNQLLGTSLTQWTDFALTAAPPSGEVSAAQRNVWADFVKTVPLASKQFHSSESAFQLFVLARYGNLDALNQAWGTHYAMIEEVFPPFASAYEITFQQNRAALVLNSLTGNYAVVFGQLFQHANAVPVTLLLIVLSILSSLTINPLAGYALSRFNMRGQDKIILFLLATSAFPAMISAIPGFLLMRDLGMLNTFFALILPGAASGMHIFILKGFFDSLPPELFEAATIDGAKEWQIFLHVTMPMVKPILAVNALAAFIAAYEGWQWALLVCQNPKMWTLAVWMYQVSQQWVLSPWLSSAGYVVISIPTLIVFLSCQRIILRGIIIPQMK